VTGRLLTWYHPRRAAYPWRRRPTPYRVLVSEVMLQQTQAARVVPAFDSFVRRFPSFRALAGASRADVLRQWAGLGYNRRAVALHETARAVVRDHGGRLPRDPEVLRGLPGIGPYTASAIASFAFGAAVPAMDTNVRRVVARAQLGREAHEVPAVRLQAAAGEWIHRDDPAAWNGAVMDLGRERCRPTPRCEACPLARSCRFRRSGRRPSPMPRSQGRFEGSSRQLRGRIVQVLREERAATIAALAAATGASLLRLTSAVGALAGEGLLHAGPAALRGTPAGRVRLPD
jgi:A/G-specific adenine glycosylase